MIDDTFKTIDAPSEGIYKEKGSRFLAFAHPIKNVEEAKLLIGRYQKEYHDSRHVCYVWVLGPKAIETRVNDDGEPSGTAGKPIYGQILSFGLTNILVIVVRYFGGILLGTGGLIVAYRNAAHEALLNAEIVECTVDVTFSFSFEFPFLNDVMKLVKSFDAKIDKQSYDSNCTMNLIVRQRDAEKLRSLLLKIESLVLDEQASL